jgi:rhamnosyltransferase
MESNIKVAILMTTFNGEKYLPNQLDSLFNQKGVDIDIYAYDDGSTDGTIEILTKFKEKINIIIYSNEINSGGTGKNILISLRDFDELKLSQYQYFSLCDQDDVWLDGKLDRAINLLIKSDASLYFSNLSMWNQESGIFGTIKKDYPEKEYDFLFEGGSAGCTYVMTREFIANVRNLLQNYPIEEKKRISHDWLFYFLARLGGHKVVADSKSYILYRIHKNSQYGDMNNFTINSIKKRINLIKGGFYRTQIINNLYFMDKDTVEFKIYKLYMKSFLSRIYILIFFNFKLMRSKYKLIKFFFVSIFFHNKSKLK